MKALREIGGKRCSLCRKVYAPNKIAPMTVGNVTGLWICKRCEADAQARALSGKDRA